MGARYAVPADLFSYALNPVVVAGTAWAQATLQQTYLDASSNWFDNFARGRWGNVPSPVILGSQAGGLGVYDQAIVMNVCYHAAYNIIVARGYNPELGADSNYLTRYEQALAFAEGVQRQRIHPDVITPNLATPQGNLPTVNTAPLRGW
jgi:hypothetical protein